MESGWLVKPDRVWAKRFYKNPHSPKPHIYVHTASCEHRFLHGITPYAVIREGQNIPRQEAIEIWKQLIKEGWERSEPLWMV